MTADTPPPLRLHYLVHDVARLQQIAVDTALAPYELTRAQWQLLRILGRTPGEPMAQSELVRRIGISKVAVGVLLERLDAKGFVTRSADPGDRRARRAALTPAGADLLGLIQHIADDLRSALSAEFAEADLDRAERALARLKARLAQMLEG